MRKQYKLSHERYREYVFKARDGVLARKRTQGAVVQEEGEVWAQNERTAVVERIKENPALWPPFLQFPAVEAWRAEFLKDARIHPNVRGSDHCPIDVVFDRRVLSP